MNLSFCVHYEHRYLPFQCTILEFATFGGFMTTKIHVVFFWVLTPFGDTIISARNAGKMSRNYTTTPWHLPIGTDMNHTTANGFKY